MEWEPIGDHLPGDRAGAGLSREGVDGRPFVELIRSAPFADRRGLIERAARGASALLGATCMPADDPRVAGDPTARRAVAEALASGAPVVERGHGGGWVALPVVAPGVQLGALVARVQRRPPDPTIAAAAALGYLAALLGERAPVEPHAPAPAAAPIEEPVEQRPRCVLLVEDEPNHAELVQRMLERRGYRVERAPDGRAGVERALASPPDLILLDVRMPAVDGFAAAAALRREERTREVPILFVSACDEVAAKVRGLELGAVDYLAKPFHGAELIARVERALQQAAQRARLERMARADALTGLGNYRFLVERLGEESRRAARYGLPLALAMIDVDGLKRLNDTRGHAAGNTVLERVGRVLRAEVRESDAAARYGGDEFVVLLPHTTMEEAARFAERVRRRLAAVGVPVTISVGVAALAPSPAHDAPADRLAERLIEAADGALYRAKRAGGDRVCSVGGEEAEEPGARP
jgi:diguanylate cyclase (GGDEF)-like protein